MQILSKMLGANSIDSFKTGLKYDLFTCAHKIRIERRGTQSQCRTSRRKGGPKYRVVSFSDRFSRNVHHIYSSTSCFQVQVALYLRLAKCAKLLLYFQVFCQKMCFM